MQCMSRSKPSSEDPKFIHFIYVEKFMSYKMSFNEFIELQNLLENLLKGLLRQSSTWELKLCFGGGGHYTNWNLSIFL